MVDYPPSLKASEGSIRSAKSKISDLIEMKIKKGDTVEVITGKDRKKRGVIEKVFPKKSRVMVAGVNLVKKHQKPASNRPGGIIEKSAPIDVSNVMLVCPHCDLRTRVGYLFEDNSKKVRVCKKCQKTIKK